MTSALRIRSDVELLRALEAASSGRMRLESLPTESRLDLVVGFECVTSGSPHYPAERQSRVVVHVGLPERYPFVAPVATVRTPIWHPNVFPSGVVCLGTKWIAAQGLDLFVQRLLRLVTYDPLLVNTSSPANREAAAWYERTRREHPQAFPTDRFAAGDLVGKVLRSCPGCGRGLRLPRGRAGHVRCPSCGTRFEALT